LKGEINHKNIADLRAELDGHKMQIHIFTVHIDDILRDSAGMKRACDHREQEISALMGADQEHEGKN
jgi:hypothetical protein